MIQVLVYSSDRGVREAVGLALGDRLPGRTEAVEVIEAATAPGVLTAFEAEAIDVAIFDADSTPAGGMGLAKQVKDEYDYCPPIVLLVGRREDAWLATWSGAEATLPRRVDPIDLAQVVAQVLAAAEAEAA